jgi:hypothetical protein
MAADTAAWDDVLQWQREINDKDRQLLRTKAMREASNTSAQELRQIDLNNAEPIGLSALKGKVCTTAST